MQQQESQHTSNSSPRIRDWQFLRGPDFAHIDRERTVVCVTCSPLEVHGPHLPVITDTWEAEKLNERCIELFHPLHPEVEFLRLPPLYVAADVLPHPGSVMFRSSTITRVLEDLGRSLAKQGFKHIWVCNFHGGPRHFVSIEVACHRTNRKYNTRMVSVFSLLIKRLTRGGTDLSDVLGHLEGIQRKDLEGDSHAGAVETAMMLHLLGEHVDPGYKDLEQVTVELKRAREGKGSLVADTKPTLGKLVFGFREKLKFYETETYSGKPSIATPLLGKQILDTLASHGAEALSELWTGKLALRDCHSPLWPVRWIFTSSWLGWLIEKLVGYRSKVW